MSETTPHPETAVVDELLSVLADSDCRAIIIQLRAAPTDTASLETLTCAIATASPTDRTHAQMRLHHSILPKLADTPLLEYDAETRTVVYHDHDSIDAVLDTIHRSDAQHKARTNTASGTTIRDQETSTR